MGRAALGRYGGVLQRHPKDIDKRSFTWGTAYCTTCKRLTCDICQVSKERKWFPKSQLTNRWGRNQCTRCNRCHFCTRCGEEKAAEEFAPTDMTCLQCVNSKRLYKCAVCNEDREERSFPASNLDHTKESGSTQKLVCLPCREQGFDPRDTTPYRCTLCGPLRGPQGHRHFREKGAQLCIDCDKTHVR